MNIYALENHKVRFLCKNGYDSALDFAKTILEVGKEYTVDHTEVGQSSTSVYLKEVPTVPNGRQASFNSVMFEDVVPQSKEDDEKHIDYKMWNS